MMLLRVRGLMTAHDLSKELEVSERTIYRDLEALSAAGVPVLTERGPGGGCALPPEFRTDLTGLTEHEVRGLFLSAVPGPLADLGMGKAIEAALLKMAAALPAMHRQDVAHTRSRVYVDTAEWFQPEEPVPHLKLVERAVWEERTLLITYRRADGVRVKRYVNPYGLVAKAGVWYMVGALRGKLFAYRVSRIKGAEETHDHFQRPAEFDLGAYWSNWCDDFEAIIPRYTMTVRIKPHFISMLPNLYGEGVHVLIERAGQPDSAGCITLTLTFESFDAALGSALSLGTGAEVIEPEEMRRAVLNMASRVVDQYTRDR